MPFRKPRAFVATPFSAQRAGGEDPALYDLVQKSIRDAAELAGIVLDHPADIQQAGNIMSQVSQRLNEVDVVIGVVTGSNPNVLFELGAAPVDLILVIDDPDKLPFDLKGYRSISYGRPGELNTLTARIVDALRQTLDAQAVKVDPPIEEYLAAMEQHTSTMSHLLPGLLSADTAGRFNPDLRAAYVPARLQIMSAPGELPLSPVIEFQELLANRGGSRPGHVLIFGEGGSGKTTLLRMLAAHSWNEPHKIGLEEQCLPLLVTVRSLALSQSAVISTRLQLALDEDNRLALTNTPPNDFISIWSSRTRRPWLFLIDGLDEAPSDARTGLFEWIATFLDYSTKNGHRVVLTSRQMAETPGLTSRTTMFRMQPLDSEQFDTLSRTILGANDGPFIAVVNSPRFQRRLKNPLLLSIAAAIFSSTGSLPTRRADLFEQIISKVLELASERGLRKALGDRIAAWTRVFLERLAVTGSGESTRTIAESLRVDLQLPPVEAEGLAGVVLEEIARTSGILIRRRSQYTFAHLAFLEHLAAAAVLKQFKTGPERSTLVKDWWNRPGQREIVLTVLGLLNDEAEVTRLVRDIYPGGWSCRATGDRRQSLEAFSFIVDCILDGCRVGVSVERDVSADLYHMSEDPELGPEAAELLAMLGDREPLIKWARLKTFEPLPVCYAIAALSGLNDAEVLNAIVWDQTLPLQTRVATLALLTRNRASKIPLEVVRSGTAQSELVFTAVHMLMKANRSDDVVQLLSEGKILGGALDALILACAEKYELDVLFRVTENKQLAPAIREPISEAIGVGAAQIVIKLAKDSNVLPAIRATAASLAGEQPDNAALSPLLESRDFSPYTKLAIAVFAMNRARAAFLSVCNQSDVPPYVRFVVVEILTISREFDALEAIASSESAVPDARSMALFKLFAHRQVRAAQIAAATVPASGLFSFARQALQDLVGNIQRDNETLVSVMGVIANAASADMYVDLLKTPTFKPEIAQIAVVIAEQLGLWPLLLRVARDKEIPLEVRVVALRGLADNHRNVEVAEISDAEEVEPAVRALARKLGNG